MTEKYVFQVLTIDQKGDNDITSLRSLKYALLGSDKLFKESVVLQEQPNLIVFSDAEKQFRVTISNMDTTQALNDLLDSAFIITIESVVFENLEAVRLPLLTHLRKRLNFNHIRILIDDVSNTIAKQIYPLIADVEMALRRYLAQFFIQKIGINWWQIVAPRVYQDKVNLRRSNNFRHLAELTVMDVSLIDFDELGELIYKQNSSFNKQESLIDKIQKISSLQELDALKEELQNNYTKYFKETFQDKGFEKKWMSLIDFRNKVAHSSYLTVNDLAYVSQMQQELLEIINTAEAQIAQFRFSVEEKEALRERVIGVMEQEGEQLQEEVSEGLYSPMTKLKVLGKIDLPSDTRSKNITEEQLIVELKEAFERAESGSFGFLGLKYFVTRYLFDKGYAISTSYALINILVSKQIIEFYDINPAGVDYPIKAIRMIAAAEAEE